MRQISEREALHKLRRLYGQFDNGLLCLSQFEHPGVEHECETLREMRDRLLPLKVGTMPKLTEKGFARLSEPEVTEQLLDALQISRSEFPAICAQLEELDFTQLLDTESLPNSVSNALRQHGATMQQINLLRYAFAASSALHKILSKLAFQ